MWAVLADVSAADRTRHIGRVARRAATRARSRGRTLVIRSLAGARGPAERALHTIIVTRPRGRT